MILKIMFRLFSVIYLIFVIYWKEVQCSLSNPDVLAISTEGCTIPGFPLISNSIRKLVQSPEAIRPNCSATVPLLGSNSSHIWVIAEAFEHFNIDKATNFYCCYRNFSAYHHVENITYSDCLQFSSIIKAKHEFVRIECYNTNEDKIYDDFFSFVQQSVTFSNMKVAKKSASNKREVQNYNVLLFGLESTSRLNFLRAMPKTSKYLHDKGSIQLFGYNKLGDNSFPNLFPFITGRSFENLLDICRSDNVINTKLCPFIWDNYKKAGYYTALIADSTAGFLGNYEYMLPKMPTDFYLQPFLYETRFLYKDKRYDYHVCLRNRYLYKELLNYAETLINHLDNEKLFAIFWEESISHNEYNYPKPMDEDYVHLLEKLNESGYLNKTVVIFFSDHGMRFGKIVESDQGRLESRLPLLEILLPKEFNLRHKRAADNLKRNKNRLTTPHDIYETLKDLVNPHLLTDTQIDERSRANADIKQASLFLPISDNRTCETVRITEHWCTCFKGQRVNVRRRTKLLAAEYLIAHVNKLLAFYQQCQKLELKKILDVSVMKNKYDHGETYVVVVQVTPGEGRFDGTLIRERGVWIVSGVVSRLNSYGDQSHCVHDPIAKMYCFCR